MQKKIYEYLNQYFKFFLMASSKTKKPNILLLKWDDVEIQKKFINMVNNLVKKKGRRRRKGVRSRTAYNFFCIEHRPLVIESYPKLSNQRINSKLGEMWRKIKNNEDKILKYKELAIEDKRTFIPKIYGLKFKKVKKN